MTAHAVHFFGGISALSIENLRNVCLTAIREHAATSIRISFSSWGGNLMAGFTAYNFIRSLAQQVPIEIHNAGNVDSIAVIVFLAAPTRIATPFSKFTIHPLSWDFAASQSVDHARLIEYAQTLDFDKQRYADIFRDRTNGAERIIDPLVHLGGNALILNAQEARTANIATAVAEMPIAPNTMHWWPQASG